MTARTPAQVAEDEREKAVEAVYQVAIHCHDRDQFAEIAGHDARTQLDRALLAARWAQVDMLWNRLVEMGNPSGDPDSQTCCDGVYAALTETVRTERDRLRREYEEASK